MEFSRVGVLVNHQYKNEIVGEKNDALNPTLDLIHAQNEGILRGIENASSYKFYARSNNFALEKDLKAEANNFSRENFGNEAGGAVLIFPNTYDDIKQIQQVSNNIVDPEQLKIIRQNVFDYFGCNEDIIQNKAVGDSWSAFYEGRIEPFAVQLSQVMTNMTYTAREKACGNAIYWTASRVQTMSNQQKLEYSTQMFDRGLAQPERYYGCVGYAASSGRRPLLYPQRVHCSRSDRPHKYRFSERINRTEREGSR